MGRRIRIVLARDDGLYPAALRAVLAEDADVWLFDMPQPQSPIAPRVREIAPDAVITDSHTACVSHPALLAELRHGCPRTPVLILLLPHTDAGAAAALAADGQALVPAASDWAQLMHTIRNTVACTSELDPAARASGSPAPAPCATPADTAASAPVPPAEGALSPREREILSLIAMGHSSRSIASRLSLSVTTVTKHRFNLMRKVDRHNIAELIRFAHHAELIR